MDVHWEVVEPLEGSLAGAADKWCHEKSQRCGRTALQFARHWLGQSLLDRQG